METLTTKQEREVIKLMAKEFLEYGLGIDASEANVLRLTNHIIQFEKEIKQGTMKKSTGNCLIYARQKNKNSLKK